MQGDGSEHCLPLLLYQPFARSHGSAQCALTYRFLSQDLSTDWAGQVWRCKSRPLNHLVVYRIDWYLLQVFGSVDDTTGAEVAVKLISKDESSSQVVLKEVEIMKRMVIAPSLPFGY